MTRNLEAAGFMLLAMSAFTLNDAVIKHLVDTWPIGQLIALRGVLVLSAFALALRLMRQRLFTREMLQRWSLVRALCELATTLCFLSAIALLPLATATTLVFGAPLVLTVLAAVLLRERVGPARWLAVIAGFGGVLLVAQPQSAQAGAAVLLPLAAAMFTALRDIAVRNVPRTLSSLQISFVTAAVVTAGGLGLTLLRGWRPLTAPGGAWIAVSAALLCAAYFCYVVATRRGELSFVAPVKYASIVLAIAIGYLVWGEQPGGAMLLGASVIVLSGLYMVYAEGRGLRRARRRGRACLTAGPHGRAAPTARPVPGPRADRSGR